ncbi:MAG: hypothetical protein ACYTG0_01360, partial [Planctomycetota bacterium]
MAKARGSSLSSTRSWRGQARQPQSSAGSRWAGRVLMTLLGAALVGWLAWSLLSWLSPAGVKLFALPVVDYDVLAVPPIAFSDEDLKALVEPVPDDPTAAAYRPGQLSGVSGLSDGEVTRERDVLILYLSGHGISSGESAYFLGSDYLPDSGAGRYPIDDLLRQVSAGKAKLKLLILDTGRLDRDPRLGMVVNQFSVLLERAVRDVGDKSLWVLVGNGPLDVSHVAYSMRRSMFGYFVSEGLLGAADGDGDHTVELDELFDYVRGGVAQWASRQSGGRYLQTPRLFRGGQGESAPPDEIMLVPVSGEVAERRAEDESAESEEAEADAADGEASGDESADAAAGEPADEESADAKPTPEAPGEGGEKPPDGQQGPLADPRVVEVRARLLEAWAIRDLMQDHDQSDGWSPVDYAPHLWRHFNELLLGYELQYRAGKAHHGETLGGRVRELVDSLRQLLEPGISPSDIKDEEVAELARARRSFLAGSVKKTFDNPPAMLNDFKEAIQLRNDLLYRAPYYLRWHGRANLGMQRPNPTYGDVSTLVTDQLPRFVALLDSLEELSRDDAYTLDALDRKMEDLRARKRTLGALRDGIERALLEQEAQGVFEELEREKVKEAPDPNRLTVRIENLLSTPLPSAELRARLLDLLDNLPQPPPEALEPSEASALDSSIQDWQWDRLRERAELEVALLKSADPDKAASLEQLLPSPSAAAKGEAWGAYRQLGAELEDFYARLPSRVRDGSGASDAAGGRLAERLLRAVDARDAGRVGDSAAQLAVRPIPPPPREVTGLALLAPSTLEFGADNQAILPIQVRASGPPPSGVSLTLTYDSQRLRIEPPGGASPITPGQPTPVTLEPGGMTEFRYTVHALKESEDEKVPLEIELTFDGKTDDHVVNVALPAPNEVDLVAVSLGRPLTVDSNALDPVHLHPYPNRVTRFQLALKNRSRRPKKVVVELLALTKRVPHEQRSHTLLFDELGNLRDDVERVAGPIPMDLHDDPDTPEPIAFPAPKTPAPKEEAAGPDGAKPPPKKRPTITHGLACVIREGSRRPWIRWIDLLPLFPWDYLEPKVSYRQGAIRIRIEAADLDNDGRPDSNVLPNVGDPIEIVWEATEALGPNPVMEGKAKLNLNESAAKPNLFAEVEQSPDKTVRVHLAVDGYPRAFIYEVECDRQQEDVERQRALTEVRIVSPEENDAFKAPVEALPVVFQVDVPDNAFQRPGDVIEVGIDVDRDQELVGEVSKPFFSPRQVEVFLDETGPQGLMRVDTKVSDFEVGLETGLKNDEVNVLVRLLLPSFRPPNDPVAAKDFVTVVLDGAPPDVRLNVPGQPVPKGTPLVVSADVSDDSK